MPLRRLAGIGLLVDWHEAHQPHETSDPFLVHEMVVIPQVPGHLAHAIKRRLQELLIDQEHQIEVHLALAFRFIVKRRPRDRQQLALLADGQGGIGRFNHLASHLPVQGLSFLAKKSLAMANSPILHAGL